MKDKREALAAINDRIRASKFQLITQDGENIGVVSKEQALHMAQEAGLDLVIIAEQGQNGLPVAKIMNFGKSLYEKKKKQAESKKHQKVIQVKEVKIRPKIGEHDYQTKMNQAIEFLNDGKRVKVTLFFRGRENITRETRGVELFDKVHATLEESGLASRLVQERDLKAGQVWSRIYYLKSAK